MEPKEELIIETRAQANSKLLRLRARNLGSTAAALDEINSKTKAPSIYSRLQKVAIWMWVVVKMMVPC